MLETLAVDRRVFTRPGPIAAAFMGSTARVVGIMGPQGGGKTTAVVNKVLMKAASQPPSPVDGVARYRCVVWMRTYRELWAKVIPDWLAWVPQKSKGFGIEWLGGADNPAEHRFRFKAIHQGREKIVEASILFRAVGDQTPTEAAKGLHTTDGWLPEATSADPEMRKALFGRLGRYPTGAHGGAPDRQLFCDWNAGDPYNWTTEYFIAERTLERDADGRLMVEFFRQPGGREAAAENLHNLPPTYYSDQIAANADDPDWIRRMVDNQIGFMRDGQTVYQDFDEREHASDTVLVPWQGVPLIIAADAGLTPAAVIGQRTDLGEVQILAEVAFRRADAETFADRLLAVLDGPRFANCRKPDEMFVDPTALNATEASSRSEAAELTSWAKIVAHVTKLRVRASRCGNNPTIRVTSTANMIRRRIGGRATFRLDRSHCPELFKGLVRDYKYERIASVNRNGAVEYRDKPTKNFASHVCNAVEYFAANAGEQDLVIGKADRETRRKAALAGRQRAARSGGPSDPLAAYRARA